MKQILHLSKNSFFVHSQAKANDLQTSVILKITMVLLDSDDFQISVSIVTWQKTVSLFSRAEAESRWRRQHLVEDTSSTVDLDVKILLKKNKKERKNGRNFKKRLEKEAKNLAARST